jgi:hypothetical protein
MKGQILRKCVFVGLIFFISGVLLTITSCGGGGGGGGGDGDAAARAEVIDINIHGKIHGEAQAVAISRNNAEVTRSTGSWVTNSFTDFGLSFASAGVPYKFYFVWNNARAFPLYAGAVNVFNLPTADWNGDVGFVDIDPTTGVAVAENSLLTFSGVSAGGEDTSIPPSLADVSFSLADLQGDWHNFNLVSTDGSAGQQPGWAHSKWTVDASGNVTQSSILDSLGNTVAADFDLITGISGFTTAPVEPTYAGYIGLDRSSLIGIGTLKPTGDAGPQGFCLQAAVKKAPGYATVDLSGSWYFFGLATGSTGAGQKPGWYWGKKDIDATGNISFPIPVTDNWGSSFTPPLGTVYTVGIDGSITATGNATFHGALNEAKKLFIATYTGSPAGATGVSGYNLQFNIKGSSGFVVGDLAGTWHMQMLTAGAGGWTGWVRGIMVLNASGTGIWRSVVRSNGTSQATVGGPALSIAADGFITSTSDSSLHGVMTADKRMIIATMTDGAGDANLLVLQK